jgi:hypothetical protein
MKLKSFGCSFIYGSELADSLVEVVDVNPWFAESNLTWPALIAKNLNLDYECHALPGQGNFKIFCDILANSYCDDQSVYLINWTWIDRFDYVDQNEHWDTLRPANENPQQQFYYRHLHSQLCDMISDASYIVSAAQHLQSLQRPFLMTFMDYNLLSPVDPNWHDPRYLEVLQNKLKTHLLNFDGLNFLDWSRKNNFSIGPDGHPLEQAHAAAAAYWLSAVNKLL